MNVGIIGFGFLGKTLKTVLESFVDFKIYDKNEKLSTHTFEDVVKNSEIVFVCVPTPMKLSDGTCDISIVEDVIKNIESIKKQTAVIIRSTITPGTCKKLSEKYDLIIFHMPEFLTEANPVEDFKNQKAIILGHDEYKNKIISEYYKKNIEDIFIGAHNRDLMKCEGIYHTSTANSELCKYFTNVFLATKVALFNEFYFISNGLNANFNEIREMMLFDSRIGESHTKVPGPDKDLGFGGHCFPKDLSNYIQFSKIAKFPSIVGKASKQLNDKVRKNKDWELMIGRAVV